MEELPEDTKPVAIVCSGEQFVHIVECLEEEEGVPDIKIRAFPNGEIYVNGRQVISLKPREDVESSKPSQSAPAEFQALFFFQPSDRIDINLPFSLFEPSFKSLPEAHQNRVLDCLTKAFHAAGVNMASDNLKKDRFSPCPLTMSIDIPISRIRKNIRGQKVWSGLNLTVSSNGAVCFLEQELFTFEIFSGKSVRVLQHAVFSKAHLFYSEDNVSPLFINDLRIMVWEMLMDVMSELVN